MSSNDATPGGGSRRSGEDDAARSAGDDRTDSDRTDGTQTEDEDNPRQGLIRRHKALTVLFALLLVIGLAVGAGFLYLNSLFDKIDRIDPYESIPAAARPPAPEGEALNILLAGADNGDADGTTIAEAMTDGDWQAGAYRSDTLMVLHIPADRDTAYLVSIPRDSYVEMYDENGEAQGKNKINAAFSLYGPAGAIATVEKLTATRMDHIAIIDWAGFKDITDALGGVEVYVPMTITDDNQGGVTFEQGVNELDGELALKYVRSRYVLREGDLGRIDRQQNFLRAMVDKISDTGLVSSPGRFSSTFSAIASNLTVDSDWSNGDLRGLAWSMRDIRAADLTLMTVPLSARNPFPTVDEVGSTVSLNRRAVDELFTAMRNDVFEGFVASNRDLLVPDSRKVQ